jgi:hypothetical protein
VHLRRIRAEQPGIWRFVLGYRGRLAEVVLDHGEEISEVAAQADIEQVVVLGIGFDVVEGGVIAFMGVLVFLLVLIVVAVGERCLNGESFCVGEELVVDTGNTVILPDIVEVGPGGEVDDGVEGIDVIQARE